ncbi:MAG: hypothetical protein PHY45_15215 [Rhodocyclaceae bacterium]|nr:hypothetical protein [Rhodocyclaceae bacterium]
MATSMDEFHMARGDAFFIEGTTLMVWCGLAMVTVLVSWAIGGTGYKDALYGDAVLVIGGIGFVVGAVLDYFAQKLRHPDARTE